MLARLPSLQSLDLSGSSLKPDAAGMLGAASGLTRIDLTETGTSMETRLNLQAALPDAAILPKISAEPPVAAAVTEGEIQNAASQLTAIASEPPIASVSLAPLPTDEAIDASRGKVQSIPKSEYAAAKTRDKQRDLARKLLALSRDFDRDDPARFVILDEAIRFALKSADWQFAVDVVDELGQTFAVNLHQYQASVMANAARVSDRSDAAGVCRLALGYATSAVDHERYAEAINLIHSALVSARRTDVPALTRRAVDRAKEITAFSKAYEESQVARTILKHTPEDAGANLTLGRYLALYRGDWSTALPKLAASGVDTWEAVARSELAGPTQADVRVKLAESWLEIGRGLKSELEGKAMRAHAAEWLRKSIPDLTGLNELRVSKLLASLEPEEVEDDASKPKSKSELALTKRELDKAGFGRVLTTELVGGQARVGWGVVPLGRSDQLRSCWISSVRGDTSVDAAADLPGGKWRRVRTDLRRRNGAPHRPDCQPRIPGGRPRSEQRRFHQRSHSHLC